MRAISKERGDPCSIHRARCVALATVPLTLAWAQQGMNIGLGIRHRICGGLVFIRRRRSGQLSARRRLSSARHTRSSMMADLSSVSGFIENLNVEYEKVGGRQGGM
jgi:hypothetical protein